MSTKSRSSEVGFVIGKQPGASNELSINVEPGPEASSVQLSVQVQEALRNEDFLLQYKLLGESSFEYKVKNDKGTDIFSSSLENDSCCCRRVFQLGFSDPTNSDHVFQMTRTGGFFCEPYVFEISFPPGNLVAKVRQEPFPIAPRIFTVTTPSGRQLFRLQSKAMFSSDFIIASGKRNEIHVGTFRKISSSVALLNIIPGMEAKHQITLIASVVYVDICMRHL